MQIRKNLIQNPSFEYDVVAANPPTNWTSFNFTDLGEVVDDVSLFGGKSWHVLAEGEAKDGGINNQDNPITLIPGKTYTVSAYIKTALSVGTAKLHLKVFKDEYADAVEYDTTSEVTGTSDWTRVSKTFTAGAGYTILEVWVACGAWGTPFLGDIWVDAVMVEEDAAAAGSYFDGNTADAHWDGVEGLSESSLVIEEYVGFDNEKKLWEDAIRIKGNSIQEIVAKYRGVTPIRSKSVQHMLADINSIPAASKTVQQMLFEKISAVLGLSGIYTQYSVQELLTLAKNNDVEIEQMFFSAGISPTLFEDFETSGDWTPGGDAGGSWTIDGTYYKVGSNSAKIVAPSAGGYFATKVISKKFTDDTFSFWVYIPTFTDQTNMFSIGIYLSSTTNFSKYMLCNAVGYYHVGWNKILLRKSDFTASGGESWNNTMVRLRFRGNADDGKCTMYLDNLEIGGISRTKVVISFDDGWDSQYNVGFYYMKQYNLKGTSYLIGELVDTTNYMTLAQVKELKDNGWDICTHGLNNLTTLEDEAACVAEISTNMKFIVNNGLSYKNSHLHYAYPNGGYNQNALDALDSLGFLTARTIIDRVQGNVMDNPLLLSRQAIINTTTLAAAEAYVDRVIATGGCLILNFHKLVASPSADTEWGIDDFASLVAYIAGKRNSGYLDVVTTPAWYRTFT